MKREKITQITKIRNTKGYIPTDFIKLRGRLENTMKNFMPIYQMS